MPKESHPRRSGRQYRIWGPWKYEIASVLLSVGLNITIALLLARFDTQAVPDWGQYLNLNALLALLSTFLRATLVIIISQVVSQRKWLWFSDRACPLSDLERFDAGSRGTLGAISLISTTLLKDPVTLIAGVTIAVSFLVGPFVQQASRTHDCLFPAPDLTASIPYAHVVPGRKGYLDCDPSYNDVCVIQAGSGFPAPDLYVAIISALTAPAGLENQIHADCSTGNCTFTDNISVVSTQQQDPNESNTHSTVGMCTKCTDVTSLLQERNVSDPGRTEYSLPTSPWKLSVTLQHIPLESFSLAEPITINSSQNLDWMGGLLTPEATAAARWAYANVTFLATDIQEQPAIASVCSLYPCMRTYVTSVIKNKLSEKLVQTDVMQLDVGNIASTSVDLSRNLENIPADFAAVKSPCRLKGTRSESPTSRNTLELMGFFKGERQIVTRNITAPDPCIYRHKKGFANAIARLLSINIFAGTCTTLGGSLRSCRGYGFSQERNSNRSSVPDLGPEYTMNALYNEGVTSFAFINSWFEAFATAMTNKFRTEYGSPRWDSEGWQNQTLPLDNIQGTAWRDSICVAMHWRWLILPWVLTIVATGLLVWTLLSDWQERHDRPVWKESILPLLLYGSRILGNEHRSSPPDVYQQNAVGVADESGEKDERLMEIDEMINVSKGIAVRLRWADNLETEIDERLDGPTSALEQDQLSLRSRRSHMIPQTTPQPSADLGEYRSVSDMDDASTVGSGNSRVGSLTTLQHSPNR